MYTRGFSVAQWGVDGLGGGLSEAREKAWQDARKEVVKAAVSIARGS